MSAVSTATGLGKGSLYNFFPGGKDEMLQAVLAHIESWFESRIFLPLERARNPEEAVPHMLKEVTANFHSGAKACLVGQLGRFQ